MALGTVSAGAGGSVNFAVNIDDPLDESVIQISNTASITDDTANGPDLNPADNSGSEDTPIAVAEGRMTGGGSFDSEGTRYTHGFELHCDITQSPNNLEINWGKGGKFHLMELTSVTCLRNGLEGKPVAGFDTLIGMGVGKLNGETGIEITFRFTDRGEPGKDADEAEFSIEGGPTVFPNTLIRGNQQAHPKKLR